MSAKKQATKNYETICVYAPDLNADQINKIDDKIKKIFSGHQVGEVTRKDWGNRKLAYQIVKYKTAHYVQYLYEAPGTVVTELERNLGYEEGVLRYITVKQTKYTPANVQVEPSGFDIEDTANW